MASQKLNITASEDIDILLNCEEYYFSVQVVHKDLASSETIDASFKILFSNSGNPDEYHEWENGEVLVVDADGSLFFHNEKPLSSQYLILRYTKNSVNAGTFNIYVAPQTEILD